MVNDARSMTSTSVRSAGCIRSMDRDATSLELGLRWPQVERRKTGSGDDVAGTEPREPENADGASGRQTSMGRRHARVARDDRPGPVAQKDGGFAQAVGQRVRSEGEIVPLAIHGHAVPAIERAVDLVAARVEHG